MAETLEFPQIAPSIEPQMVEILKAIHTQLVANAEAVDKSTVAAQKNETAIKALNSGWKASVSAYNEVRSAIGSIVSVVSAVADLAAEQEALDRTSQRLALDFNEAADGAGRFVDETEAMNFAARTAEAGLRLTQHEMNELTARAAIMAQNVGITTTEAFDRLYTAVVTGSERALRPMGAEMTALGGSAHTARERVDALVHSTEGMPRASDDASTAMARFRDTVDDAARTFASAASTQFTTLAAAQERLGSTSHDAATAAEDMQRQLRAAGQTAGEVALTVVRAVEVIGGGIAAAAIAPAAAISTAARALNELRRGNFQAAQDIITGFGSTGLLGQIAGFTGRAEDQLVDLVSGRAAARVAEAERQASTAAHPAAAPAGGGNTRTASGRRRRQREPFTRNDSVMWSDQVGSAFDREFGRQEEVPDPMNLTVPGGGSPAIDNAAAKAAENRHAAELAFSQERERTIAERERNRQLEREAQEAEERVSLTHRVGEILKDYGNTVGHVRDSVVSAFSDMTSAVSEHVDAFFKGKETLRQAGEGILADTFAQVSKRASVFAVEEQISAIASLARGDFAGAGLHEAAALGFVGLAALAGAGSAHFTPDKSTGGSKGGAGSARDVSPSKSGGDGGESRSVTYQFFAPVVGGLYGATPSQTGVALDGYRRSAQNERRTGRDRDA